MICCMPGYDCQVVLSNEEMKERDQGETRTYSYCYILIILQLESPFTPRLQFNSRHFTSIGVHLWKKGYYQCLKRVDDISAVSPMEYV